MSHPDMKIAMSLIPLAFVVGLAYPEDAIDANSAVTGKRAIHTVKDDRFTTNLLDRNSDGRIDEIIVKEQLNHDMSRIKFWRDRNKDGKMDYLRIYLSNAPFTYEEWRESRGGASYLRRDEKALLIIKGAVSAFESRDPANVTSESIPLIEKFSWGWNNHEIGLSVIYGNNRPQSATLKRGHREIAMDNIQRHVLGIGPPQNRAQQVTVREWELSDSELPRVKKAYVFKQTSALPFYNRVDIQEFDDSTTTTWAKDRNCDGQYDWFMVQNPERGKRVEEDTDFDGLLDKVVVTSASGEETSLTGDAIPVRRVRFVETFEREIEDMMRKVIAGPTPSI